MNSALLGHALLIIGFGLCLYGIGASLYGAQTRNAAWIDSGVGRCTPWPAYR